MVDPQFDFQSEEPLWRQQQDHIPPQQQNVFGSNFVRHYPVAPIVGHPKYVEFQLSDLDQVWAMGPNTRFVVSGMFQVSKPPPEGQMPEWEACTEEELDKVVVQPNFFKSMIKGIDFFHGNSPIKYSSEIQGVSSFLNAWKYNYMDKDQKKNFAPMTLLLDLEFRAKWVAGTWMIQPLNGEKIMDQKYLAEKPSNLTTFFWIIHPFSRQQLS